MSFTFIVTIMLLGSSMVFAFVLQPFKGDSAASAASADSLVSPHRCQGESLQSIRKSLLRALNLQIEPQLPAGGLEAIREQWRRTSSGVAHRLNDVAVPARSGFSGSADDGNSTSLRCCSMASEVFMKDLGWNNWVIAPTSLTIVRCALCNPEGTGEECASSHTDAQGTDSQVPCCQPVSHTMVPVVYMDEFNTVVISSVQLTSSCGCESSSIQQPSEE